MFRKIILKNFRTHVDTSLELGPITLLIGANNSGKSNLLAGIRHFARLTARGRPAQAQTEDNGDNLEEPESTDFQKLSARDFFPHRHRLAANDAPMSFTCLWTHQLGKIDYSIELYENQKFNGHVGCRERIKIKIESLNEKEVSTGWDKAINTLSLRTKLESEGLNGKQRRLTNIFFRSLSSCYLYDLQPSFLSGQVSEHSPRMDDGPLRIAAHLGIQGGNLQSILHQVRTEEPRTYERFLASLQRFEGSFRQIGYDDKKKQVVWLFDLGREAARFDEFQPDVVSGGLLRAAAIALLCSMLNPPALILLEEIENGINQRNIGDFLRWLQQAAGTPKDTEQGYKTQFIVTTHSPSVLREFSDHLDAVYHIRREKRGYKSVVRDLNSVLAALVDVGTVEGSYEERENGEKVVKVPPDKLTELWYSGVIGG